MLTNILQVFHNIFVNEKYRLPYQNLLLWYFGYCVNLALFSFLCQFNVWVAEKDTLIAGYTESCHFDNFQCSQYRQNDISISVLWPVILVNWYMHRIFANCMLGSKNMITRGVTWVDSLNEIHLVRRYTTTFVTDCWKSRDMISADNFLLPMCTTCYKFLNLSIALNNYTFCNRIHPGISIINQFSTDVGAAILIKISYVNIAFGYVYMYYGHGFCWFEKKQ